jgi:hypothetical protein
MTLPRMIGNIVVIRKIVNMIRHRSKDKST